MRHPGRNTTPGHIAMGAVAGLVDMLKGLAEAAMVGTLACLGAEPWKEEGALFGSVASTPHMNTRGERLRSPVLSAGLLLAGSSAVRQARMREAAVFESSLERTFRPDRSKHDADILAFDGVIMSDFLSVTDDGRAEKIGFQSGEPDIAVQRQ